MVSSIRIVNRMDVNACQLTTEFLYSCVFVPVITVSKLHVHAVATQKGLAVERCVDVWWMGDGLAHHDHTGKRWLFKSAHHSCGTAVTHLQVTFAVQHLKEQPAPLLGPRPRSDSRSALTVKRTYSPSSWLTWGWRCARDSWLCISFSWRNPSLCSAPCLSFPCLQINTHTHTNVKSVSV